jgi:hypothetical protein
VEFLGQNLRSGFEASLVADDDDDAMIPSHYSLLVSALLPDAVVKIYPDAAHGFLFQLSASSEN